MPQGSQPVQRRARTWTQFHSELLGVWVLQLGRKLGAELERSVPFIVVGFPWVGECGCTCPSAPEERGPSPRSPRAPAAHHMVSVCTRAHLPVCFPSLCRGFCFSVVQTTSSSPEIACVSSLC